MNASEEPGGAIVTALDVDAALDINQRAAVEMGEVRAPLPLGMQPKFPLEVWAAEGAPEEGELRFETGRREGRGSGGAAWPPAARLTYKVQNLTEPQRLVSVHHCDKHRRDRGHVVR